MMATQERQELKDFLESYDTNGTGSFDRDRWLHLCTSARINLPQEGAATVFDKLDSDRDGLVKIDDLLNSLSEWQRTVNSDIDDNDDDVLVGTGRPVDLGRFAEPNKAFSGGKPVVRPDSLYGSSAMATDKEFGKSVMEAYKLSKTISESYPELAASFNHLLETFKRDIMLKKYENADLEQSYNREKQARKEDMKRLEEELDAQIQMVEEKLRRELSKKYEAEYLVKLRQKEIETERYREAVQELKEQVQTNYRKLSSLSGYPSGNVTPGDENAFKKITSRNMKQNSIEEEQINAEKELQREADELRKKLREAQKHLTESETELAQLRTIVETQSSQLHIEKMRASSFVEEKDILYDQIQKLKDALREVQGKHAYLQDDFLERAPDLQMAPWQRDAHSAYLDSGQWSGSNSDRPNLDPENASVTNWSNVEGSRAPDRIFRVILVGDSSVGKTCFMHRFCTGDFYYNARSTVGVDFKTKNMVIDGNVYTIEIWDTAGQEKYHSLVRQYFRKCDGAILMYDVSNRESFNGVREWMNMVEDVCGDEYLSRAVVGNKIDLRDGLPNSAKPAISAFISTGEGENLAKIYNAEFVETSVLNSINVDEVVVNLVRAMKYRGDCQNSGIKLNKKKYNKRLACCNQ